MDGSASGIIHNAADRQPSVWRPDPVGRDVIDDGGPDEQEQDRGTHFHALCRSSKGESRGDASKHELENEEGRRRNAGCVWVSVPANVLADKMGEVSNEWSTGLGKCERIAPEIPLPTDVEGIVGQRYKGHIRRENVAQPHNIQQP